MNNINDLQEQFENLIKQGKELLEKIKENQSKRVERWKPKNNDKYYFIWWNGEIGYYAWTGSGGDNLCFKSGNCFKTYEEAQKELDRRVAEQELIDMCDWEGKERAYFIEYNYKRDVFDWDWFDFIYSPYRFASEESVKKAIEQLGTEKLKLIFRIN